MTTAQEAQTRVTLRQSGWWKRNQRALMPWLFLMPGILLFAIYVLWPIISSISISLYQWDGLSPATYVGVENYIELMDDEEFYTALWNHVPSHLAARSCDQF